MRTPKETDYVAECPDCGQRFTAGYIQEIKNLREAMPGLTDAGFIMTLYRSDSTAGRAVFERDDVPGRVEMYMPSLCCLKALTGYGGTRLKQLK